MIGRFVAVGDRIVSGDAANLRLDHHAGLPLAIGAIFDNGEVRCERDRLGLWLHTIGANLVAIMDLYLGFDPEGMAQVLQFRSHSIGNKLHPLGFSHGIFPWHLTVTEPEQYQSAFPSDSIILNKRSNLLMNSFVFS